MRFSTLIKQVTDKVDTSFDKLVEEVPFILEKAFKFGLETVNLIPSVRKSLGNKFATYLFSQDLNSEESILLDLLSTSVITNLEQCRSEFKKSLVSRVRYNFSDRMEFVKKSHLAWINFEDNFNKAMSLSGKSIEDLWLRTIGTAINDSFQEGRLAGIFRKHLPGNDPFVYKRVEEDGCDWCKTLYLEEDGKTPKLFKASELRFAGSNYLRKANNPDNTEWKATLGSAHPWCRCILHELPDGYGFDSEGNVSDVARIRSNW